MKKKTISLLLVLALMLALFAGCGNTAAQTSASASADEAQASVAEASAEAPAAVEAGSAAEEEGSAAEAEDEAVPVGSYGYQQYPYELPLTDEEAGFTMFSPITSLISAKISNLEENRVYQELEERTGVHMEITSITQDAYVDQLMLTIASGDWTDIVIQLSGAYSTGLAGALEEEVIVDLSEYAEYMPNYISLIESDPALYRDVTLGDGEIASVYTLYDSVLPADSGILLRGDWLDALGLESPTTIDEYYEVMKAFQSEYGAYTYLPKSGLYARQGFLTAYDICAYYIDGGFFSGLECFYHEGDTVKCGFLQDGFKQYLQFLNKLYDEDLVSHDYISTTSAFEYLGSDSSALSDLLNDKIGIWGDMANNLSAYDSTNAADPNFTVRPGYFPTLEKGGTIKAGSYMSRLDVGYYSVTTACEDIELLCQWMDYSYTDEGIMLGNWGFEGETYEVDADGKCHFTDVIMKNDDMNVEEAKGVYLGLGSRLRLVDVTMESYTELQRDCLETWTSNYSGEYAMSSQLSMTTEEGARYGELVGDVITYLYESVAKFITGELNFEGDYDEFLENLRTLNIDEMTEIEQAMYDRWNAGA